MKNNSSLLKLIALVLTAAAVICVLAANLEAIANVLEDLCGKTKGKLSFCPFCRQDDAEDWDEEEEFVDWDE